ncbi:MAG: hypothetical protein AAF539_05550 [Planctomycetota bacterium]
MNANEIIQSTYLPTRAKLLEVAATLDRIDAARRDGVDTLSDDADLQLNQLRDAIGILTQSRDGDVTRACAIQRLFSRSYDPEWRAEFGMASQR